MYYSRPAAATNFTSPSYTHKQRARGYRICDNCGTAETPTATKFRLCGGCMVNQYCSVECQKSHWRSHKYICQHTAQAVAQRPATDPKRSASLNNPPSIVDTRFDQTHPPESPTCPTQRSITAQSALDHAAANKLNISAALASLGISEGAYFIQVGFNEDMILLGQGALQEIYIHINFEIPADAFLIFNQLGKALSPFPSVVVTPTVLHQIPVFSQDGKALKETEFWALMEDRGIFRRDLSVRVPHNVTARGGHLREGGGHSYRVEVNRDASATGESSSQPCSDNTGGSDTGGGRGSGGAGSGSGSGSTGFQSGDYPMDEGGGSGRPPGGGGSPSGGGLPGNGGNDGGDDPGPSSDERDRGPQNGELSIPLSAVLDVEWDQDPRISQRFSTTSKVDIRMREDGDTSFPGPLFEVNFSQLRVETRALAETQYSLHFTRVQIIASRHPTTVLDNSPNTTPSAENTVKAKEGESSTRAGGITIGQTPSLKFAAATSRQSETEEIQNRSKVAVFLNAQGAPGDRVMQWDYSIDDKHEQQCGRTFENPPPPRVKLGFDMPNKPDVEIDLLMYWSTLHKTPTQPSRISRLFSSKGKNRVTCAPAFANLLQQVSISVPLEDLKGSCWFFGPAVEMKTVQPSPDVGLQCKATGQERVRSKGNQVDLKVSFGCALYGQANNRKEITDAPPPPPLLRSLPQNANQISGATQQPVGSAYTDENLAKNLRKFTSAHTALLEWAGFQALRLKRIPANVRQSALLIELSYRTHSQSHRRFAVAGTHIVPRTYLRDPLVVADIQRREERCRQNGGIGTAVVIIQCGGVSQVMPVEVDTPSKITWDTREDWDAVLRHFVESGRTDFKPISTTARGVYYG